MLRLYLDLEFDRPFTSQEPLPSPGGFEVQLSDGTCHGFDFLDSCGHVDGRHPERIQYELANPDTGAFPGMGDLPARLGEVAALTECYVDVEGCRDPLPAPVAIRGFCLEVFDPKGVSRPKKANVKLDIRPLSGCCLQYVFDPSLMAHALP